MFVKGQSGNPGGRPKGYDQMQALARKHTPEAIAALAAALKDPDKAVAAASVLLDRAWGKPPQANFTEHSGNVTLVVATGIARA